MAKSKKSSALRKWRLETRDIDDLKEHEKNPRTLSKDDFKHLKESIAKFGMIDKPIITNDGRLIGGHQRVKILKAMGHAEVECWVCDDDNELTQQEIDELNIRLNKNTGEWNWQILANEWQMTDLLAWGFTEKDFEVKLADVVDPMEEGDEEELTPPTDPITKPGDLYILGDHRLLCGDSTLPDDVARLLDGGEPILMVTDPPYGVNYDASWRDISKIGNDKGRRQKPKSLGKVQSDDQCNWALAWTLFPGSVAYVWSGDKMAYESVKSLKDSEYEIVGQIIWSKQHFALSRGDYHSQHESCWYAVKKGHTHNWQGSRKESTLWEISNHGAFGNKGDEEKTNHSTQKPIECMARPIRNNTAEGEGVYDPFVGSGTTIIACEKLKRKCYAMEIDPVYCDMTVARWEKMSGKKAACIPKEQDE